MKRTYLKFYGKIIGALLSVLVAFSSCCTKKPVEKAENATEKKDTTAKKDTIPTYRKGRFPGGEVIAMYGVRPDRIER
ncbi:MAG: hypothetical protein GX361_01610 [Bacteroidales bacterium]|nr:hypothetical protein [Bacteroidales bacterium]